MVLTPEKYESQLGYFYFQYMEKNVPNHKPNKD